MKRFVFVFISTIFVFGVVLFFTIIGIYSYVYRDKVYPGVYISGQHVGNWTKEEVETFFKTKNEQLLTTNIEFVWENNKWATSGALFNYQYDNKKIANKAFQFGRERGLFTNLHLKWGAFWNGFSIPSDMIFDEKKLTDYLLNIASTIDLSPIEGLFEFQGGKVTAFKISSPGRALDIPLSINLTKKKIFSEQQFVSIQLPVKIIKPKVSTEEANNLGIVELLGRGESYFKDSIPSRVHNITLGTSKFHGVLISPGEIFSFNKNVGTISAYTGYQQGYVIEKGKTVLGDGGGVCQVSTTLFRAALYAGLPMVERVAHSYRVSYYEPPLGFDATIYDPEPDFKFKNDTGKYILIQTFIDDYQKKLTFELYGTGDGREIIVSDPVIVSQTKVPPPKYQDDSTLPKGVEKQIDTAHPGANVYFTRKVTRNKETLIDETIRSIYIPWAAVILRGTKE